MNDINYEVSSESCDSSSDSESSTTSPLQNINECDVTLSCPSHYIPNENNLTDNCNFNR